jgi:pentapeptide repeat protein
MANPEHHIILKKGVDHWNKWRKENPQVKPSLDRENLSKEDLSNTDLSDANLRGSNLIDANLWAAKNLTCAQIQSAKIDKQTQLPDYIKITWADTTHTCEKIEAKEIP